MASDVKKEGGKGFSLGSLGRIRENPWILATILLAVVLVAVLVLKAGSTTGNVVSGDAAAQNLMSFIKAQGGGTAELVSTERNESLYKVIVKYNGQEIPVFVTLDGEYLVSSLIPLDISANNAAAGSGEQPQTPAEVPKSAKPKVELFVMALCPYGTQMEKGIIPVVNLLGSKIDFSIKYVSYSMHGKIEIDENTRQYCIQKEQPSKFIGYLQCYLKEGKSSECLASTGVEQAKLNGCIAAADKQFSITANFNDQDSWLSGQYPMYNVNAADAEGYGVQGSPTLIINGAQAQSARDSASLLKTVCAAFTTAPSECGDTLSGTAPSPGFGYEASASGSANTAAGCGA